LLAQVEDETDGWRVDLDVDVDRDIVAQLTATSLFNTRSPGMCRNLNWVSTPVRAGGREWGRKEQLTVVTPPRR